MKIIAVGLAVFSTASPEGLKVTSAAERQSDRRAPERDRVKRSAEVIRTMNSYQASLEKLLKIHQDDFKKKVAQVQQWREFYEKGYISRVELEQKQIELGRAEAQLRDTEQRIGEVKIGIAEVVGWEQLRSLPPLRSGEYIERGAVIRYNGTAPWSPARAAQIRKFFSEKFKRALPVSAMGQTPFHERMKFDHRHAMDVAVHPDSVEGRSLMTYLRGVGVPFIAFRSGVPGSATGAHIHIGRPSARAGS